MQEVNSAMGLKVHKSHEWGSSVDLSGPWHFYRERLMMEHLSSHIDHGRVLDVGFGSGTLILNLARLGFDVTGVDISEKFLKYVMAKLEKQEIRGKITVQKGSITDLQFSNQLFDSVVCGEVLEHIMDDRKALREIYRVTKPGGILIVTVPANQQLWSFVDEWAGHYRRYSKSVLTHLLEEAGFDVCEVTYCGSIMGCLYHKYLFLPYYHRKIRREHSRINFETKRFNRIQLYAIRFFSYLFCLDHIFQLSSKGIGLIAIAQRR